MKLQIRNTSTSFPGSAGKSSTKKSIRKFGIDGLNVKHFVLVTLVILVLPVVREWRTFIFGERVEGLVVGPQYSAYVIGNTERLLIRTILEYEVDEKKEYVRAPDYYYLEYGDHVPMILKRGQPGKYIIATFPGFFLDKRSIALVIIFIIWVAFYSTVKQFQKGYI